MVIRNMMVRMLCGSMMLGVVVAPAFADGDWRRHEQQEWREHAWREHDRRAWREHEWREHEWRDRYRPPFVQAPPTYGYYAVPPGYYANPGYYR